MACPNFKNGQKNGLGALGVNWPKLSYCKNKYKFFQNMLENVLSLTPKVLGVFFMRTCLKTTPIQSKIDCAKLEPLLVHLTIRSCS
jgi:hypothetical protein